MCFAPCYEPERRQDRKLGATWAEDSAACAFGRSGCQMFFTEQQRSAYPSTSTGERRENMSQLFFCFRRCDSFGKE
jgi:hypothetical protein